MAGVVVNPNNAYGHAVETTPGCGIDLHRQSFQEVWHRPEASWWVVGVNVEALVPAQEALIGESIETVDGSDECNHEC